MYFKLIHRMSWLLLLIHSASYDIYIYGITFTQILLLILYLIETKFAVGNLIIRQLEKWMKKFLMFCPHFCLLNHGLFYKFVIILISSLIWFLRNVIFFPDYHENITWTVENLVDLDISMYKYHSLMSKNYCIRPDFRSKFLIKILPRLE